MSCGFTNPVGCVEDVIGGAASSAADSAFNAIAHDFGQAADSVVNWLWGQLSQATSVSLGGPGFNTELSMTAAIAATIGLGLFVIQVVSSVLRREPGSLARAARGLLVAFVAGGAAVAVTNLCLGAVDALSNGVVEVATGGNIKQMGTELLGATALSAVTNGAVVILLSLVMVVASAIVWAALMVRKLLIVVAAVFAPIAFAGSLAEITTAWVRRWIETMIALVFSKLVLVIIFTVGLAMLAGGAGQGSAGIGQSLTQVVTGALVLVMAGFSPWLAIKLVHFTGDAFHTVHAQTAAPASAAQRLISAPQKMSALRPPGSSGLGASHDRPDTSSGGPGPILAAKPPAGPPSGLGAGASGAAIGAAAGAAAAAVGTARGVASRTAQTANQALPEQQAPSGGPAAVMPAKRPDSSVADG